MKRTIKTPHLKPFEVNIIPETKVKKTKTVRNKTREATIGDLNEVLYNHLKNNFRLQNFINRDF